MPLHGQKEEWLATVKADIKLDQNLEYYAQSWPHAGGPHYRYWGKKAEEGDQWEVIRETNLLGQNGTIRRGGRDVHTLEAKGYKILQGDELLKITIEQQAAAAPRKIVSRPTDGPRQRSA